jgi:hypothetical protein
MKTMRMLAVAWPPEGFDPVCVLCGASIDEPPPGTLLEFRSGVAFLVCVACSSDASLLRLAIAAARREATKRRTAERGH